MKRQVRYSIWGGVAAIMILIAMTAAAVDNPQDRIDYWQKTYTELKPSNDPRVKQGQEVFNRVLMAAGSRSGVIPRLLIVNYDKWIACALPDGGIVISKKVLDICYKNPGWGNDRLAFVLGHEIAHQLKDDFWHLRFFQAVELSKEKEKTPEQKKALEEVQAISGSNKDEISQKEQAADVNGIVYAAMAGYNTTAVVTEDDKVNFFEELLTDSDLDLNPADSSHPSPKQRAEAVKARLRQVLDNVEVFNLGVSFYQAGKYEEAIKAFRKFMEFFPSREVYHDYASSYHQLALENYQSWKGEGKAMPFKLSMAIDPSTLASGIALKGPAESHAEADFKENIKQAIEWYQRAIALDPSYYLSYNNLGCALILKGDDYEGAVSMLKKALTIKPDHADILNNLGVAYFYAENPAKAKESLAKAQELDPKYSAPLFNLAKIAQQEKNSADAKKYGEAYLKLDAAGPWADMVRETLSLKSGQQPITATGAKEKVLGLGIGVYDNEVPKDWRIKYTKPKEPYLIITYANRIMTISQDDEIMLIVTLDGFGGKSVKGIALGAPEKDVLSAYGAPAQVLDMTQGTSWVYRQQGIAFQLRNGKVVAWVLF